MTLVRAPADTGRDIVTFFSIPKPFEGHIGIIQRNAIRSWSALPSCRVVLFGSEPGLAEAADDVGALHVPALAQNERGTPLVSDAFERIRAIAETPVICYVNADILFTGDVVRAARFLDEQGPPEWLLIGRRKDLDVGLDLEFGSSWERDLIEDVSARGIPHGFSGIDYFLFPRRLAVPFPPLAVGRPGWDNWFIFRARRGGIPVVDASNAVLCVHQNHPPRYRAYGTEARRNSRAGGGFYNMATLRDADWRLEADPPRGFRLRRRGMGRFMFSPPVRGALALRRYLAERLGQVSD